MSACVMSRPKNKSFLISTSASAEFKLTVLREVHEAQILERKKLFSKTITALKFKQLTRGKNEKLRSK